MWHVACGMWHVAWGMGHGAWGMGHGACGLRLGPWGLGLAACGLGLAACGLWHVAFGLGLVACGYACGAKHDKRANFPLLYSAALVGRRSQDAPFRPHVGLPASLISMLAFRFPSPPRLTRIAAVLACAAGLGVWGVILLAPRPATLPPALRPATVRATDTAPAALLFGKDGTLKTQVNVTGLIAGSGDNADGAVILSVDGGPAQAWRAGQEIAPGLRLVRIDNLAIVLDQNGTTTSVSAPPLPPAPAGIVTTQR